MTDNKIRLPFGVDPAPPYQMLYFHYRQGVKKRFYERQNEPDTRNKLISLFTSNFRKLINLPDNFSLIIMPSEYYLIPFFNRNNNSILTFGSGYNGIFGKFPGERVVLKDQESIRTYKNNSGDLFISDTDLFTGYFINDKLLSAISENKNIDDYHLEVSASLLSRSLNFELYPSVFFNTKFMFGFYPGFLVWILNNDLLKRYFSGDYDSFGYTSLVKDCYCHKDIGLMDIYVMSEISRDMAKRGLQIIRNEMIYKSVLLYQAIERSRNFELLIKDELNRSASIICMRSLMTEQRTYEVFEKAKIHGNYHQSDESGLKVQIGNFPVHSKEQAGYLADVLEQI